MTSVEAIPVADRIALFDTERPGLFCIEESGSHLWFECPCGCGGHCRLRLYPEGTEKPAPIPGDGPAWSWDGNRERPTLKPSIRQLNLCYFHGHLTNGAWTFEGDSGVKPA